MPRAAYVKQPMAEDNNYLGGIALAFVMIFRALALGTA
jgi:hypothetical protein